MNWDDCSDVMTAKELAALLKVSRQSISNYVKKGDLPHIRFGQNLRFIKDDVRKHIERRAKA